LLEQLNLTDLKDWPETAEPLELFEESLRKAVVLVESCRDKSYLYLVAMGWVYVNKFRDYQDEIDKYLKLIPLISLVEDNRVSLVTSLFPIQHSCNMVYILAFGHHQRVIAQYPN
jgi:hypothetical protein